MAQLVIKQGADYTPVMTFANNGTPTLVSSPVLEIRQGEDSSFALILRCDSTNYISQATPGVLVFDVPASVTQTLQPGNWYWDLFGTVSGVRVCLADTDRCIIEPSVSLATDS